MKILHVLYSGLGGHGNVFFSMVDADRRKEFQYEAIFFGIEDIRKGYIEKAEAKSIPWYFVKKKQGFDSAAHRNIRAIIKKSAPDIVFIHGSSFTLFVKSLNPFYKEKFRLIVRETQPNHLRSKAEWAGLILSLLRADKLVFLNPEFREITKKKFPLLFSEKRSAVIPNGVDLSLFSPKDKKADDLIRIGMQGRLSPSKDQATLIRAFHRCIQLRPQTKMLLLIAGDGNCRGALEAQVKEAGLTSQVNFTGMLEETDLAAFINSLDIYVHATLGEMMSTAILQVMACKKPVIASDVFGVNNMVKDGINGLLVPPKMEEKLAGAILSLIDDPLKATLLAEKAYAFATRHYGNDVMFSEYKKIFAQII